jgi:hypothetical protein
VCRGPCRLVRAARKACGSRLANPARTTPGTPGLHSDAEFSADEVSSEASPPIVGLSHATFTCNARAPTRESTPFPLGSTSLRPGPIPTSDKNTNMVVAADPFHREHAVVELAIRDLKEGSPARAHPARSLPRQRRLACLRGVGTQPRDLDRTARRAALPAIKMVRGAPIIIKLLEGTQGIGVILAPDAKIAEAIIETLQTTGTNVLLQRFVAESKGKDIRALVVGDRVVAAMRRIAQGDAVRSNVHSGGHAESIDITPE